MKKLLFICLLTILLLPSLGCQKAEIPDLTGKHVAVVLAEEFNYSEANSTLQFLHQARARVTTIGPATGTATPYDNKQTLEVEKLTEEVSASEFDGIIVPGGTYSYFITLRNDEALTKLLVETAGSGKVTAAVCIGPAVLGSAGILQGRRYIATSSLGQRAGEWGAEWVSGRSVVQDENIITASGPAAMRRFNEAIGQFLALSN